MKRLAIIATALLLSATAANAQYIEDGNQLLSTCTKSTQPSVLVCSVFVAGVGEAVNANRVIETGKNCIQGITHGQERDVVVRYLQHHPESRHLNAGLLATVAIEEAWCPSPLKQRGTGDGDTLLRWGTGEEGMFGRGLCMAFLSAFRDTLDMMQEVAGGERCLPPSVSLNEVKDVVIRSLKQKPETRHDPAVMLIAFAVRETWCPAKPLKETPSVNYR